MSHKAITYKSKAVTVLLTLCLGALGAHRFYLGNTLLGVLYLIGSFVIAIVFMPALIGITVLLCLEAVYFLCRGKQYYKRTIEMEVVA